jgi:hypothetical protein
MADRPVKITLAQMRNSGVRGILVYCADYRCSHSLAISADAWPDDVRLSDIEPRFCVRSLRQARRRRPAELQLECPGPDRRHGLPLRPARAFCCPTYVSAGTRFRP